MKKIYLSDTDSKIKGVCGGIAEYFNVDSSIIRILWVLATIATGLFPGVIAYIAAVLIMPRWRD